MLKKMLIFGSVLMLIGAAWFFYLYLSIDRQGSRQPVAKADALIILGAAVWPNGPSPALQARVAHTIQLYEQGMADWIIVSGGLGDYPPSEAEAMRQLLLAAGVPDEVIVMEDQSVNTIANLRNSKQLVDERGLEKVIIVSDAFHIKRALTMAQDVGLAASGAPAADSVLNRNKALKIRYTAREVLALSWYYVSRMFN